MANNAEHNTDDSAARMICRFTEDLLWSLLAAEWLRRVEKTCKYEVIDPQPE
jgi:hypothetical protein